MHKFLESRFMIFKRKFNYYVTNTSKFIKKNQVRDDDH